MPKQSRRPTTLGALDGMEEVEAKRLRIIRAAGEEARAKSALRRNDLLYDEQDGEPIMKKDPKTGKMVRYYRTPEEGNDLVGTHRDDQYVAQGRAIANEDDRTRGWTPGQILMHGKVPHDINLPNEKKKKKTTLGALGR